MQTARLPWECSGRNDLYCRVKCTCPSDLFKDSSVSHIMKHVIVLIGYNDAYFWDEVNKEKREGTCKCGKKYFYQWFRDGVDFEWIE